MADDQRVDGLARSVMLGLGQRLQGGTLVIREGERTHVMGRGPLEAEVRIRDARAWHRILVGGSVGMGQAYMEGQITTPDLTALLRLLARNIDRINHLAAPLQTARWAARRLNPSRVVAPSVRTDRRNIHAHYDLGNRFFQLFLDPTLAYSCGIFETPDSTLEQASLAKFDRLCRKLRLSGDDHLLEIGTGWGGLAIHAATTYGCRVTTTTISGQQYEYARERVRELGLEGRVTVLERHYRELEGRYSKVVSVEMIEAVDARLYNDFFRACQRLLEPDGLMAMQAIVIADREFRATQRREDFIKRFIFPGGCLPSVTALLQATTRATALRLVDLVDIGAHYAPTLRLWRENLEARQQEARGLGLSEAFLRMWRFYFAYCEAGFLERRVSDVQLVWAAPGWRDTTGLDAVRSVRARAAVGRVR